MSFIRRDLIEEVRGHLGAKEFSIITGPRQVGKTTLMQTLMDELNSKGERTIWLNYDYESDNKFFHSQDRLIQKIKLEIGDEKGFVFIDEIQRKENAGLFLKGIYDLNLPYKFIISGSGSLELKEKIHESLAGRKRLFRMNPVTFSEFVNYKTQYQYNDRMSVFLSAEQDRVMLFLEEYMDFGGYPRIITENIVSEKHKLIGEIYSSYLQKDIAYLMKVERPDAFNHLIKMLAAQIGGLVKYAELASKTGLAQQTVRKYLWYAQETFIVNTITPFYKNIRKEITKSPMIYFTDLGLRNYTLGLFGNAANVNNSGFLFENLVGNTILEKIKDTDWSLHFWRTTDKAEVDFIIDQKKQFIPLEVKYIAMKKPVLKRSLRSFIEKYSPENAFVINLSLDQVVKINETSVRFLPYSKLIENNLF